MKLKKKILKIVRYVSTGITILLLMLFLLISSGLLNPLIKRSICIIASGQVNGDISIAKLNGNIFKDFSIDHLQVTDGKNTVMEFGSIEINYRIWDLFHKNIKIDTFSINEPLIYITEDVDSVWNIQKLISSNEPQSTDTLPFNWGIELNNFIINSLKVEIHQLDTTIKIPQNLRGDVALKLDYKNNKLLVSVHHLNMETQNPYFQIIDLKLKAQIVDSVLSWKDLELSLDHSNFKSIGSFPISHPENAEINIKATPIDLTDFKPWLVNFYGGAELFIVLKHKGDSSILNLDLKEQTQTLKILAKLSDFNNVPKYFISARMDSFNFEYWTHNPDFKSLMKGVVELQGQGFDLKQNTLSVNADFAGLSYDNHEISNFSLFFEKDHGNMNTKMKGNTIFGDIDAIILIQNLFDIPVYDADLNLKHLNLAKISKNKIFESDLNMRLKTHGTDYKPGKIVTSINLQTGESIIFGEPILGMNANFYINKNSYSVKGFHLETHYLNASIHGNGNLADKNKLKFNFKLKNIENILTAFEQHAFHLNGEMDGEISGPIDSLRLMADILISEIEIDSLRISDMQSHIQSIFSYDTIINTFKNSSSINNLLTITPENFSLKTKSLIGRVLYKTYIVNNIELDIEKKRENLIGSIKADNYFGSLKTHFNINNTFSIPEYYLSASLKNFDLAKITMNDSLHTFINFEILAKGKDIKLDSIDIEIEMQSKDSEVFGWPIEDFNSKIVYKRGYYRFDKLDIKTPFAHAKIQGEGNINANNKLEFYLVSKDPKNLNYGFLPGKLRFNGEIKGSLTGTSDSMIVSSTINVDHFKMDTIHIENIFADAYLKLRDSTFAGYINLKLNNSKIQDLKFGTVQFRSDFTEEKAQNSFSYYSSDSLNGNINTSIDLGKTPTLHLNKIDLNFPQGSWIGENEKSFVRFGNDSIVINEVKIVSNESSLRANGIFTFKGNENLQIDIQNIDLVKIPGIQLFPFAILGNLNASLTIEGTAKKPVVKGFANLDEPMVDIFQFQKFGASFTYVNDYFSFESFIDEPKTQLIHANFEIPYHLSFTESFGFPSNDTPLKANLLINNFDLSRLNHFTPVADAQAKGFLSSNINLENTIGNPKINGNLNITEGEFSYNTLGMFYNNILFSSKLINNQFQIDSLTLFSSKGKLQVKGLVEIDSLFQGELKTIDLNMKGTNFKLFNSEIAKASINTDLEIKGTPESPTFSGKLAVLNSTFNVDLFMRQFNRVYDNAEKPMLVVARNENLKIDLQNEIIRDTIKKPAPDMYKNLKGSFDIEFPRNTWIKGKNMNFELAGNIKAIKEGSKIDFFGTLNVKRGYYKLYGRQLDFEEGEITFTGGSSINPKLNFNIAYSFRDPENTLRKLNVFISDRLSKPTITFFIDDVSIEEKDAISYLLFNKGLNQLDTKENSTLLNQNIDLAMRQISGVVKNVLQSKLGLDVMEIRGNNGWTQSTVSTGKYLTNKIYLNYEYTFAIDKKDKVIQPQKITLEYQFYRSLFLQATNQNTNSGFDFGFKWSWK